MAIAGATASTYVVTAADVGSTLRLAVTAVNASGQATASSAATGLVAPWGPSSTALPVLSGQAVQRQT